MCVHTSYQWTAFILIFFFWQLFYFWWNIWLLSSLFFVALAVLQKCSAHSLLYLEHLASQWTSSDVFLLQQFPLVSNVLQRLAYLRGQKKITFWLNWQFAELWSTHSEKYTQLIMPLTAQNELPLFVESKCVCIMHISAVFEILFCY